MLQTLSSFIFLSLAIPTLQKLRFQYFTKSSRCLSPANHILARACHCIAPCPTNLALEWPHHPALYSVCTCSNPSSFTIIIIPSLQVINSLKQKHFQSTCWILAQKLLTPKLIPFRHHQWLMPTFVCTRLADKLAKCFVDAQHVEDWIWTIQPLNIFFNSHRRCRLGLRSHDLSCSW